MVRMVNEELATAVATSCPRWPLLGMATGFIEQRISTADAEIFVSRGGSGPPLLLLHGFPETHAMWREIAPRLAERFTVVAADLRGYGQSSCPPSDAAHAPYSKRVMAQDMATVMSELGFDQFSVAGHDRGGRVVYRLALDHPDRITRLAVLDIVPGADAWDRADARFALNFWPWTFLAQPSPLPERLLERAPEAVIDDAVSQWATRPDAFPPDIRADYAAALADPQHAHAICEEYRAAATIDREHDAGDRTAGRRIDCPVLVLWSAGSGVDRWYTGAGGPLAIWRNWARDVRGNAVEGGHFFPEAQPEETAGALGRFFSGTD
jgi:haloacetate dehalogenase